MSSVRQRLFLLLFTLAAFAWFGCLALSASATARSAPHAALPAGAPSIPCETVTFTSPVTYTTGTRPRSATADDFNDDGNLDLVVTDYSATAVSVLKGNGNGTFQAAVNYTVGFHPVTPAIGDLNEDGNRDLVVANYNSGNVSVLLGNGDGTFASATNFSSGIGPYGATVGDFNEDGHLDVAVSNVNFGVVNIMLGNGEGGLGSPSPYGANPRPQVVAAADLGGDGYLDLAVPNYSANTVSLLMGNGNGSFQTPITITVEEGPDYLTLADLNADSRLDIVLSHYSTHNLSVLLGNGNGTFQSPVTYPSGAVNPTFVAVGDFNGDGNPDLSAPSYGGDAVTVLPGNGNGTFQPAVSFPTGAGTSPVAVVPGDFNHDTRLDLFTANENTDDASVLINNCQAVEVTPTSTHTPPATATATYMATTTSTPTATSTATAEITPTQSPTPCSISFSDVAPSDYFYEAVRYLYCRGAVSGYGDGTFRPYNLTTRGQLAKIVVVAEGWPIDTSGGPHFSDVPESNPFYGFIETAYNRRIVSGYGDGTFRWGNNATRAQLCKIIVNAQAWPIDTTGGPHFIDVPPDDPFYASIETAYNHGVISGYAGGLFLPGNNATRGQISKIVHLAIVQP